MSWRDRAGATDFDRDEWTAERRRGVTATEIRDLAKARNLELAIARLVEVKRTGSPAFAGTAYTAWGKVREPFLADYGLERLGMWPETRVFHAVDNDRFLASPDAVSDDGLSLGEYKTHGPEILDDELRAKYTDQCQWQMFVLGADRVYLIHEIREGEPGAFTPGELGSFVIERDDERIAFLRGIADQVLTALDAQAETVDAGLAELVETYLATKAAAAEADQALRQYLDAFDTHAAKTPAWSLSYVAGKPRSSFDTASFKADHPEMVDQYMRTGSPGAPTLRVNRAQNV